jgi:hypothetical protein
MAALGRLFAVQKATRPGEWVSRYQPIVILIRLSS